MTATSAHHPHRPTSRSGFTLVEALVVVFIISLLAAFGFPALEQMFTRSKLTGSAREIAIHLGRSRVAAMRLGRNVVVVPIFDEKRLVSFVDDNGNNQPDTGEQEIASLPVPSSTGGQGIYLMGPDGVSATVDDPADALEGLTTIVSVLPDVPNAHLAIFQPDGSIRDAGGFRISDGQNPANLFEVRIAPPATARIEILKYVYGDTRGETHLSDQVTTPAGSWFGQGGNLWEWY